MILKQQRGEIPFSMVPWSVLNDTNLSWKAKGLLAYLLGKPTGWKVQTEDLVRRGSDGEDSVRSGLKEIRDAHYGRLICVRSKGVISEWEFTVTDMPNLEPEPTSETADNPDVVSEDLRSRDLNMRNISNNQCSKNEGKQEREVQEEGRFVFQEKAVNGSLNNPIPAELPKPPSCSAASPQFNLFWKTYPRRVAKGDAVKAFARAIKKTTIEIMVAAIRNQVNSVDWTKNGGQFIPHPSTWLNQERWLDEVFTKNPLDTLRP